MFNENLKTLRQKKGYTQEDLANKLNVVRQTVSKWEKGLSLPDADMLSKIAEVLDCTIGDLLGCNVNTEEDINSIVTQLSKISEQLEIKNKRNKKILKIIGIILLIFVVLDIVIGVFASQIFKNQFEWMINSFPFN